eukprot:SAG31_NODE_2745_length_5147_cov_20.624604_7_plen_182_part_00
MTFLGLVAAIGPSGSFCVYAFFCAIALWFVKTRVPETRGRTLEEIEGIWVDRATAAAVKRAEHQARLIAEGASGGCPSQMSEPGNMCCTFCAVATVIVIAAYLANSSVPPDPGEAETRRPPSNDRDENDGGSFDSLAAFFFVISTAMAVFACFALKSTTTSQEVRMVQTEPAGVQTQNPCG